MLHEILAYWGAALLLIAFSQCDRCQYLPVENIAQWELVWDQAKPFKHSLSGMDPQKGITCHVPSEEAVYYLNPTGECWRFKQSSEGGLTYEKIASFSGITDQQTFFAFSAGSTQEQTLHVGMLGQQHVTLTQYKAGAWKPVGSALNLKALRGAACSIHEEKDQLNGLIALKPKVTSQPPIILVYNAATQTLVPSDKWKSQSKVTPSTATEIAPGIVLLGSQQFEDTVCYLSQGGTSQGKLFDVPDKLERLSLFVLKARELMKKAILVLYTKKYEKTDLKFYTLEVGAEKRSMKPSHDWSKKLEKDDKEKEIDHSTSVVIPFSDTVYVVAQDKDDRLVYYRGSIQAPSKRVKEEAKQDDPKAKENKE